MAVKQSDAGARRTRRRLLPTLWFIALVSTGVIVGFAGTGGTYAAWNSSATVSGATISTGSAAVQVSRAATGNFGASLDLGTLPATLGPGDSVVTSFAVKNTGTTPVVLSTSSSSTASNDLASALTVGVGAPGTNGCTSTFTVSPMGALNGYRASALGELAAGASENLCLVVSLSTTATKSAQTLSAPFTLTLTGTQVAS